MTDYEEFIDRVFFNEPGVSENMRYMCHFLPYNTNLSEGYPPAGFVSRMLIQRALNLPQDFVNTFTANWGIITIKQFNKTTGQFYLMIIIYNDQFLARELGEIIKMQTDDNPWHGVMVYEATNYQQYSDIPIGRFNVDWNNFNTALVLPQRVNYRLVREDRFTDFHRALQYMLISFYFNENCAAYDVPAIDDELIQNHYWYNMPKALFFTEHVRKALTINCYVARYTFIYDQFGRRQLVRSIIVHNNN